MTLVLAGASCVLGLLLLCILLIVLLNQHSSCLLIKPPPRSNWQYLAGHHAIKHRKMNPNYLGEIRSYNFDPRAEYEDYVSSESSTEPLTEESSDLGLDINRDSDSYIIDMDNVSCKGNICDPSFRISHLSLLSSDSLIDVVGDGISLHSSSLSELDARPAYHHNPHSTDGRHAPILTGELPIDAEISSDPDIFNWHRGSHGGYHHHGSSPHHPRRHHHTPTDSDSTPATPPPRVDLRRLNIPFHTASNYNTSCGDSSGMLRACRPRKEWFVQVQVLNISSSEED